MVKVFAEFPVSVASRGDVEVTLHLIAIQAAEDATRVAFSPHARRLGELLLLPRRTKLIMHIPHFFPPRVPILALSKSMRSLSVLIEIRGVLPQQVSS